MKLEQSARREETSGSRLRVPVTARAQLLALQPPEGLPVSTSVTTVGWSVSVGSIVGVTGGSEVVTTVGCSVSVGNIVNVTGSSEVVSTVSVGNIVNVTGGSEIVSTVDCFVSVGNIVNVTGNSGVVSADDCSVETTVGVTGEFEVE